MKTRFIVDFSGHLCKIKIVLLIFSEREWVKYANTLLSGLSGGYNM
jgi:hypothetical protein